MSLLYSILKPIVRKVVKGSSLHREESYEEFKQASYDVQKKFRFALPKINGYKFRDEQLDGFHIIVGKEAGSAPDKAVVYFPGGGSRRWQLPYKSSVKNYIRHTGAELWIPLYPLLPDHDLMEETEFTIRVHEKMLEKFRPENIVWLGFSGGADVLFQAGRHMVQKYPDLPMPGMMIPVSCSGLLMSDEAKERMKEIDPRDPLLQWDMFETMVKYYDPNGNLPQYILGKADEDDYTGFPKVIMYFAGDEVFAGIAPDYEKSFIRCGVKDYEIKIREGMPHAWPVFTFLPEGREGEREIIADINAFFRQYGKDRGAQSGEADRSLYTKATRKSRKNRDKCLIDKKTDHNAFEGGRFDLVTAFETVYFWPRLTDCFAEVCRVLKPGGTFLIVNESNREDAASRKWEKTIDGMRCYAEQQLVSALKAAGFSEVKAARHADKPWLSLLATK